MSSSRSWVPREVAGRRRSPQRVPCTPQNRAGRWAWSTGLLVVPGSTWFSASSTFRACGGPPAAPREVGPPHAHCRDSPAQIGADAVRGVFAGLVEVLDLVVVDVPRSWALQDWALPDGSLREAAVREAALLDFAPREAALPSLRAVVVAGAGIVELAALAATAPRVAARVPETYLVLRGRRLSRSLLDDVGAALDLPVLGVLDDDPSVGRDLARGIPPGRSRGPLADLARAVVEALGGDRREAAS